MNKRGKWLAACVFAVVLSACGGGGGESGGGGDSSTGLIPAAGPLGETLAIDALALRPLAAGSVWRYRGRTDLGANPARKYTSRVSQTSGSGGSIEEALYLVYGDDQSTQQVRSSAGTIFVRQTLDLFGTNRPETIETMELRSPVRRGDRITLFERSTRGIGGDIDGDSLEDTADIAAYSEVVGIETVALAELGVQRSAVRVDVTVLVRLHRSSDGATEPVINSVESTWYAPGIGPIRRTVTQAATAGVGALDTDEVLIGWQGSDDGLGLGTLQPIEIPGTATLMPDVLAAARAGDRALLATRSVDALDLQQLSIFVLSSDGRRLAVGAARGLAYDPNVGRPVMASAGSEAVLLHPFVNASDRLSVRWHRLSTQGTEVEPAKTVDLNAAAFQPHETFGNLQAAGDGSTIWVLWRTVNSPFDVSGSLMLQAFDASGAPLSAAKQLQELSSTRLGSKPQLGAAGGRAVVTWATVANADTSIKHATVDGINGTPNVRDTGINTGARTDDIGAVSHFPVVTPTRTAIVWNGPLFTHAGNQGPLPNGDERGVWLDAAGGPVRTPGTANLDEELFPATWTAGLPVGRIHLSTQDGVLAVSEAEGRVSAEALTDERYLLLTEISSSAPTLTAGPVRQGRFTFDNAVFGALSVDHVLVLDGGRYLVCGSGGRVGVVYWR